MLLIDDVKYEEWIPATEDEFEEIIKEHAKDIFGEESIYFDLKKKLITKAGIGSIPDGYVISFQEPPCWYICEVELHTHPLYEHIVPQITKFINGVKSFETQREIINALDREISGDPFKEALIMNKTGSREVYRFISNLISKPPMLAVLIDQRTKELEEVCDSLPIEVKTVEFQTFTREGVGLPVHAHLFEPLYKPAVTTQIALPSTTSPIETSQKGITVKKLIDANILKVGQIIHRQYNRQRYEGNILADGSIQLTHNGRKFNSPSAAATDVTDTSENGWIVWYTTRENGTECLLDELRKEYKSKPSP